MAQADAAQPRCLIVEDEVLIGMDLEDGLGEAGFDVQWATSAQTASELLNCTPFDVAILDIIVRSEVCVPLAGELKRRRIPFLVYSGYPRNDMTVPEDVPWLEKPAEAGVLTATLIEVMNAPAPPRRRG